MSYDAVVVGAGPNGLAAAITLARAGREVLVLEANDRVGGAARSGTLTRPGFVHDLGSAVHPMGAASPFFRTLPLERHGLEWLHPEVALAHPLDGGQAAAMYRSLDRTADRLGPDATAYRRLMEPFVRRWEALLEEVLQPMLHLPRHPLLMARFGPAAISPATWLARLAFRTEAARALFAGHASHSNLPLSAPASSAFGLVLGLLGHVVGWPSPRGGAQAISDALAAYLVELGGRVETGRRIASLRELPSARAVLLDVTPRQLLHLDDGRLPARYRKALERWRYGPAAFKVDYALSEPIPWAAEACRKAGTIHVGGTLAEVAAAEGAVGEGRLPERPFVLLAQPTLFDDSRAPEGKHVAWAYCHVPNGSGVDMTAALERQVERFAPGFRDCVIERAVSSPSTLQQQNANLVGGDISGGAMDVRQLMARPVLRPKPYRTPVEGLYLCSSSTPPGGAVHGMCGHHAARTALDDGAC